MNHIYRRKKQLTLCVGMIFALLLTPAVFAQVRISQVLYDPVGTESGGEFILLENSASSIANISGWTIATGASQTDVVLPAGSIITPSGRYLIADKGWNSSRDNMSWPLADIEDTMTLANVNSGVALLNNGSVVDAVGWGNASNPSLYRGVPASPAAKGQSLRRVGTTGSNDKDFVAGIPTFISEDRQGGIELSLMVTEPTTIQSVGLQVEDDDPANGIQLIPFPGAMRLITVNITINGSTPDEFVISAFGKNTTINPGSIGPTNRLSATIAFPYHTTPGGHSIVLLGRTAGTTVATTTLPVNVEPVMAVSIDSTTLAMGSAAAGSTLVIKGDEDHSTTDRPTIWNTGNVQAGLSLLGTDLVGPEATIPSSAIQVTLIKSKQAIENLALGVKAQEVGVGLGVTEQAGMDLSIAIPLVPKGRYSGRLWMLAGRGG